LPLRIDYHASESRAVLVIDGELDLVTAPQLAARATTAIDDGAHDVIIDISALTFCDSSGLSIFVRIANRLRAHSGSLALVGPSSLVRRVLEVSGLDEAFIVVDDVPDALAALDA
jgi:anti-sigma B factor antagonist